MITHRNQLLLEASTDNEYWNVDSILVTLEPRDIHLIKALQRRAVEFFKEAKTNGVTAASSEFYAWFPVEAGHASSEFLKGIGIDSEDYLATSPRVWHQMEPVEFPEDSSERIECVYLKVWNDGCLQITALCKYGDYELTADLTDEMMDAVLQEFAP